MIAEICKVLPKYQITLPKDLRDRLNLNLGDKVVFVETADGILIKKLSEEIIQALIKNP